MRARAREALRRLYVWAATGLEWYGRSLYDPSTGRVYVSHFGG